MNTFLTTPEIQQLTGYKHAAKQRVQLGVMGIEFVVNKDGQPMVLRAAVESKLGHKPAAAPKQKKVKEPDFSSLKKVS